MRLGDSEGIARERAIWEQVENQRVFDLLADQLEGIESPPRPDLVVEYFAKSRGASLGEAQAAVDALRDGDDRPLKALMTRRPGGAQA